MKEDKMKNDEKFSGNSTKRKNKLNILIKTNRKVAILLDSVKGFLIALLLITLIVFFASAIIHNILRVVEASNEYKGKYKKLYTAGDGMMNLYTVGDGERIMIILPSLGDSSPVMKYKALADSLSTNFKVVIAEPLGYGYSLSTKDPRTSKNIVNELREALENAKISGPYTLLAFSNSSIYANYYSEQYPSEINGIITVDAIYPESLKSEKFKDRYLPNLITNIKFYSMISFSGLFRWQSYISPDKFNIDKMQENSSYGEEDIKLYRNRIANKWLTKEMRNEINKIQDNMKELEDFKFNESLPTLQIITTDYRDEYLEREENISRYATNLMTNKQIQRIRTIEGNLDNYLFTKEGIRDLKNLINMYF
ncbi:MAG: hypothetical protein IJ629_01540 [Clostridia bacterium]|nr:hypothetical protein [Clostridia bacterium]